MCTGDQSDPEALLRQARGAWARPGAVVGVVRELLAGVGTVADRAPDAKQGRGSIAVSNAKFQIRLFPGPRK